MFVATWTISNFIAIRDLRLHGFAGNIIRYNHMRADCLAAFDIFNFISQAKLGKLLNKWNPKSLITSDSNYHKKQMKSLAHTAKHLNLSEEFSQLVSLIC